MTSNGGMPLIAITEDVEEISVKEFNVRQINSIKGKYSHLRQQSKAP